MTLATVLSAGRRRLTALLEKQILELLLERKFSSLVPGDLLVLTEDKSNILKVQPRKNLIQRSYFNKTKEIVANLDELWIVTAPHPLFNTTVLDRCLSLAESQNLQTVIIFNKQDLDYSLIKQHINYYQKVANRVLLSDTKTSDGFKEIEDYLANSEAKSLALCGVSGVGKSSILERLLPDAPIRTSSVSQKTGQGRQTTSHAQGYLYQTESQEKIVFDLPGIQSFGLTHFDEYELKFYFREFQKFAVDCEYKDCQHILEPVCGVKKAIDQQKILTSRYESYKNILKEIEKAKAY